jgi:uncharacterized protein YbjT (DUF2867 family)
MILITAPTSTIGRDLIENLLDREVSLRLLARDPAALPPEVRERAEVIEGSHGETAAIERATEGARAVFWLPPNIPDAPRVEASFAEFTRPACGAFARQGVERVVGISAIGRGTPMADRAGLVAASLGMDDLIAASGVAYRAVVCPSLMRNLLNQVASIKEQRAFFMTLDPDRSLPLVSSRDVAVSCARLLIDESWDGSAEHPCLGPEDLSPDGMASIISEVVGTDVVYKQIPGEALKDRLLGFGYSEAMAQAMVDMFTAKNEGLDNAEPRTPESRTPTTFRQWCEKILRPRVL